MLVAITLFSFGFVLVYLANRIGKFEVELKSFLDRSNTSNLQLERLLEEAVIRNVTLRELINDLVGAKESIKRKPEVINDVMPAPVSKSRRARTDEEKQAASERAKQRWAERKAAAKLEVSTQPNFDESRVDTRAIQ